MKRDYLNKDETNQFMVLMSVTQIINGERNLENKKQAPMYIDWTNRSMMTKEQAKWLKTANTYLNKFIISKLKDLSKEQQKKVLAKISKFDFKLIDDYTWQKISRDMEDKFQFATLKREDFNNWCEEIMLKHCKDCTKDRCECNLFKVFDDNLVPDGGFNLPSCPYAYSLNGNKEGK